MQSVNIHEAKTGFSKLIAKVENKGSVITICRYGKPVAKLIPAHETFPPRRKYPWLKNIKILGDITQPVW